MLRKWYLRFFEIASEKLEVVINYLLDSVRSFFPINARNQRQAGKIAAP